MPPASCAKNSASSRIRQQQRASERGISFLTKNPQLIHCRYPTTYEPATEHEGIMIFYIGKEDVTRITLFSPKNQYRKPFLDSLHLHAKGPNNITAHIHFGLALKLHGAACSTDPLAALFRVHSIWRTIEVQENVHRHHHVCVMFLY